LEILLSGSWIRNQKASGSGASKLAAPCGSRLRSGNNLASRALPGNRSKYWKEEEDGRQPRWRKWKDQREL